jgi:hypothetical protein
MACTQHAVPLYHAVFVVAPMTRSDCAVAIATHDFNLIRKGEMSLRWFVCPAV